MATQQISFHDLGVLYAARVIRQRQAAAKQRRRFRQTEGPRGFRLDSPRWVESVLAGKGIALRFQNQDKLAKHASTLGLTMPPGAKPKQVCAAIAARIK